VTCQRNDLLDDLLPVIPIRENYHPELALRQKEGERVHSPIGTAVINDCLIIKRQNFPTQTHASGPLAIGGRTDFCLSAELFQFLAAGQIASARHLLGCDFVRETVLVNNAHDKIRVIPYGCA